MTTSISCITGHLQHHPHAHDDESAGVEGRLPLDTAVRPENGQGVDPGVAGRDAEEGGEGAVEAAELVRGDVREERHAEDGVWEDGGGRHRVKGRGAYGEPQTFMKCQYNHELS
jgi:hypothetical protein